MDAMSYRSDTEHLFMSDDLRELFAKAMGWPECPHHVGASGVEMAGRTCEIGRTEMIGMIEQLP